MKSKFTICLFCFLVNISTGQNGINGPDAPDVEVQFEDNAFVFQLSNESPLSNNFSEQYLEFDPGIDSNAPDLFWSFQGYIIFQVMSETVNTQNTSDTSLVRMAAVVDKQDVISNLTFITYDLFGDCTENELQSPNMGLPLSIVVSTDPFTGQTFFPEQEYCFRAYAYATNLYSTDTICDLPHQILLSKKAASGDLQTFCVEATINPPVGLNRLDKHIISIHPNPSNGLIQVDLADNAGISYPLHGYIYNTIGQEVSSIYLNQNVSQIDLSHLNTGMYLLRIGSFSRSILVE